MASPTEPNPPITSASEDFSSDNLKLWLCELTHLSPQQIETLMAHREELPSPVSLPLNQDNNDSLR